MADKTAVAPMDSSQKNSPVSGPSESESTVMLNAAASKCFWNGQQFADGAVVACEGTSYECTYGRWAKVD